MTIYTLLADLAFASLLILIGQLLRSKIKFIQSSFIPASLLAGFMGLILGSEVLGWMPFSKGMPSYAGMITVLVFASVGINGVKFSAANMKKDLNRMGAYACYKVFALAIQMCMPVAFSILVVSLFVPDISNGFGLLLAAGFYGGHGTAAALGSTFEKAGWLAATDIGMTFATIGILSGIFGGLIAIKWATRNGCTHYVKDFSAISNDLKTGLITPENRQSMGQETVSSISLDALAFHLSLVLVPAGFGYLLNKYIENTWGLDLPTFTVAFILAFVLFLLLGGIQRKGVYQYVDSNVVTRIGSAATDYLVFFGVASIKLTVVLEYAIPLAMLSVFGILLCYFTLFYMGSRMTNESWFERCIFVFGYATGVFAIGLTLLRIVDPENRSKTLNDTAITGPINTPLELFAWALGPAMLLAGGAQSWTFIGAYFAISVGVVIIAKIFGWWYTAPLNARAAVEED